MKTRNDKLFRKFQYAQLKGVTREYISKLIRQGRLKTEIVLGMECIVDCKENDDLFLNPAYNRQEAPKKKVKNK